MIILLTVWLVYRDGVIIQRLNERIEQVNLQIETVAAMQKQAMTKIETVLIEQKSLSAQSSRFKTEFDQRLVSVEKMLPMMIDQQELISNDFEAAGDASSAPYEPQLAAVPQPPSDSLAVVADQNAADSNDDNAFFYYQSQGDETLWSIAKHHYGNGIFYPLLLEYNPGLGIYYDSDFKSLKILKDRKKAAAQLRAIIVKTAEGSLLRYRVAPGDRWPVLSRRFYGDSSQTARLIAVNDNIPLTVDTRILIPLPE